MARNGKRSASKSDGQKFDKFHIIEFNDRERFEFNEWQDGRDFDLSSFCVKVTEGGWKVSFSYSEHYCCYFGSLTCKQIGHDYENHTFSVRHADFDKLARLVGYVQEKMLSGSEFRLPDRISDANW